MKQPVFLDFFCSERWLSGIYKPLDETTPEGQAEMVDLLKKAIDFRHTPDYVQKIRMRIPYSKDGIFGTPIFAENVLVVCDQPDAHTKAVCKRFCELFLKTDDGSNSMSFTTHASFPQKEGYRAVIWVRDGEEDVPFEERNLFYGQAGGKPVYVIEKATIDACRGKDADSNFVISRLTMIYDNSLESEEDGEEDF